MKQQKVIQKQINSIVKDIPKIRAHSFTPVDKRFLHLGDKLNFNLYIPNKHTQMSLFLQSNTVIDKQYNEKLQKIEQLFTSMLEKTKYDDFLEINIQNILDDKLLTLEEKTNIIYETSGELTNSLYSNPSALKNAKLSKNIVSPILQSILYNEHTISSYIQIIKYDYYTHTHSLNVSIYALCLGAELNLSKDRLIKLGRSALLHDLGKSKIESNIVNKVDSLTDHEYAHMKKHSSFGYDIAKEIGIVDKEILDGILHHHEKLNGTGYPEGLKNEEIKLFPRIIAICDVFDAMTTKRSYKNALSSFEALSVIKAEMQTHLDKNILNAFIKMLHT
ncbi:MAG: HD-GYP domain-containing protein (c-di-GMP phosphodiesterase class II) [Sulfurimonas sp.]